MTFKKIIRKFQRSSEGSKPAPHNLQLNLSNGECETESFKDSASFVTLTSEKQASKTHQPVFAKMLEEEDMAWTSRFSTSHDVQRAEMLDEDNMAWGPR